MSNELDIADGVVDVEGFDTFRCLPSWFQPSTKKEVRGPIQQPLFLLPLKTTQLGFGSC